MLSMTRKELTSKKNYALTRYPAAITALEIASASKAPEEVITAWASPAFAFTSPTPSSLPSSALTLP